jgi:hypothetical protein
MRFIFAPAFGVAFVNLLILPNFCERRRCLMPVSYRFADRGTTHRSLSHNAGRFIKKTPQQVGNNAPTHCGVLLRGKKIQLKRPTMKGHTTSWKYVAMVMAAVIHK